MKHSALALGITGVISVGAGVAIAGLPNDPPSGELVIRAGASTTTTTTTTVAAPAATIAPLTTDEATGTTEATESTDSSSVPVDDGDDPAGGPDTTDVAGELGDDGSQVDDDGDDAGDDAAEAIDPVEAERDRGDLVVATVNASGVGGIAGETAERLEPLGYNATPADAVRLADVSTVYFADGLTAEAARLAIDLGWTIGDIAPMTEMPALRTERIYELVALIGTDQA
ncbi:MAG: LytR C-terminal domain-containing protein [Ilumatobacter sp.]|uniref:LytR C-terminal domain-containing protein n=1 Tax=Ilumatobacter sp. TaxID=1967498 RepID=UPI0026208BB4|nr:LytR C-terminal domain-containing protein [Ilumatobacter sp.]MDJ0771446.1 LytR C-terminal domain-containing protein [Ilumatobacter sp.]